MTETAAVATRTQERALDAALELIARWGVTKTTLGDIAAAAGMSRATLHRAFGGGRDELLTLLAQREVARFLAVVSAAATDADDLATALVEALHTAATHLDGHEAVQAVLEHEPELAVPVLGFGELDRLLRLVRRAAAPSIAHHFPDDPGRAGWTAEWLARLFVSGLVNPTEEWDLTDRDVCARLVGRYLVPALVPSSSDRPVPAPT